MLAAPRGRATVQAAPSGGPEGVPQAGL